MKQKKLDLKKFHISKINNPKVIVGGNSESDEEDDPIKTQPTLASKAPGCAG